MEAALISTMDCAGGDQKGSPWAQPRMARPREAPPRWSDFQRDLTEERRLAEYDHRRCRIVINVSGLKLETQPETLSRFPDTLLGDPARRRQYYDSERREYFFDRHRPSAEAILAFYQTGGKLHRPSEVPLDVFTDELRFFQLGDDVIEKYRRKEGCGAASSQILTRDDCFGKLWLFLEIPNSSIWSKLYAVLCVGFILLSISSLCLETLPSFSERAQNPEVEFTTEFFWIETVCVAWFTLEVVLRFVACPSKKNYFRSVLNVFDVLAIVPYFITVSVVLASNGETSGLYRKASLTLRLMRLVRVLRIFKLSRYSEGLKMMGSTLAGSGSDIGMLLVFMVILVILFASAIYYVEQLQQQEDSESHFSSIPDAFWWAIVTMVTLGYGDTYPQTGAGKFVGSLCALAGILTISLPVPVIVTQFDRLYNQKIEKDWEESRKKEATGDNEEVD
ncbi:potassium voltage-gated channel subfamily A member 1-like isoform X1 [Branchiostoma lanceolatum]|uniref:potassium voltage-gated channel subfamily A member 1-like isoform X1 n=1 Tax=Branchiostoma lanceolatum TaxID=7740 RepID=UPI0034535E98